MKIGVKLFLIVIAVVVMGFSRCAWAQSENDIVVQVKHGDYLCRICNELLEDPNQWPLVAARNHMRNPGLIHPDDRILIPVELTKGVPTGGRVVAVVGQVRIWEDQGPWQPVAVGQVIREENRLQTGDKSTLRLEFDNGIIITLRSNTEIKVLRTRRQDNTHFLHRLFIKAGRAIMDIRKATGAAERFEIRTPSAIASVRGTYFRSSVDRNETTRCEVLAGRVRVRGSGRMVQVAANQGTVVRPHRTPLPPRKLQPPPTPRDLREIYKSLPLDILLSGTAESVRFRYILSRDPGSIQVVREGSVAAGKPLHWTHLADGTYYLRAFAADKNGLEGKGSKPYRVRLRTSPMAPIIQEPVAGSEVHGDGAPVTWLRLPDAHHYRFQVAKEPSFSETVEDRNNVTRVHNQTRPLPPGRYCFQVTAIAADGFQGPWSDPVCFHLTALPPAPQAEQPEMTKGRMTLRWRDMGPGHRYHLQLSRDPAFSRVLLDKRTSEPHLTLKQPKQMGKYYVRVSTIDAHGYEGRFSKPQSFDVIRFPFIPSGMAMTALLIVVLF